MALLAFPIVFWIGGDDESLGFIVLAIIAGFAAVHSCNNFPHS